MQQPEVKLEAFNGSQALQLRIKALCDLQHTIEQSTRDCMEQNPIKSESIILADF